MCAYKISQCLQISSGQLSATIVWAYMTKKQQLWFQNLYSVDNNSEKKVTYPQLYLPGF